MKTVFHSEDGWFSQILTTPGGNHIVVFLHVVGWLTSDKQVVNKNIILELEHVKIPEGAKWQIKMPAKLSGNADNKKNDSSPL